MTLKTGLAVSARSVQFTKVANGKARNRQCACTVVLQYFIRSTKGTSSGDSGRLGSFLVLDRECILAYCRPPNIGKSTSSLAMDTLDLVGPDDNVREGATSLNLEDCIGISTFSLSSAGNTAVEHHHATIERSTCCDCLRSAKD